MSVTSDSKKDYLIKGSLIFRVQTYSDTYIFHLVVQKKDYCTGNCRYRRTLLCTTFLNE